MFEILTPILRALEIGLNRRRLRDTLNALSDHHLADIGIERGMVDAVATGEYPWPADQVGVRREAAGPLFRASLEGCG